ncbi:MAG TPA: SEC-C metal-binding domain-containing protein [Ktedonobacteraceae bacterium]|jgi:hypothetical protein
MDTFDMFAGPDLNALDPEGGVLVITAYWRPRPGDPDPEQPGEKLSALSYLPTDPQDTCPCGSGKRFAVCCQPLHIWRPVCPNPGMQGYALMRPQMARFSHVSVDEVRAFLHNDERLYCVGDAPQRAFWVYWGDPVLDAPSYGSLCFGDIELRGNGVLLVSALSDRRMEVLCDLLQPLNLGTARRRRDPLPRLKKPPILSS